jgi:AraC-like DNA-binding protein
VIVQVTFYIALILRRLEQHRIELVQLFASTEHLELRWVRWLAVFLIVYAFVSLISAIADNPILLEPWESMIDLALLWFVIAWGLRQKLGLATELAATHEFNQKGDSRYKHSGLTEGQRRAIAKKIAIGMQQANLYRDPGLSLRSLSKHIVELPSYVSQALNQEIGESFFDYVNRWRVEEAKQRLDDSTLTVLAIAEEVGFNSRSSFYNAFKKTTGQTPSAYKKSLRKS